MNTYIVISPKHFRADGVLSPRAPKNIKLAYFINRSNKKHNFKFDYSLCEWTNVNTAVRIICPIHGEFTQKPQDHYSSKHGCQQCGNNKLSTPHNKISCEDFIQQCAELHNNRYTYEQVVYTRITDEIIVTCPVHGNYTTIARNHYQGRGVCPNCYKRNSGFYSEGYFTNHPEAKGIAGKLYFVRLYNDDESFYKVGITKHSAYHRFYVDDRIPYNIEVIKEVEMPLYEAYIREQQILEEYKDYYVEPNIDFAGRTECLNIDIRNLL